MSDEKKVFGGEGQFFLGGAPRQPMTADEANRFLGERQRQRDELKTYEAEIYANGYLAGLASLSEGRIRIEAIYEDGLATNASHVWFDTLESRYKITVERDSE